MEIIIILYYFWKNAFGILNNICIYFVLYI